MTKLKIPFMMLVAIILSLVFFPPLNVDAYVYWDNNAKLEKGVYNQEYWLNADTFDGKDYSSLVRTAVSDWNYSVNSTSSDSTDVYFTKTSYRGYSNIEFYVDNYGSNIGWNGNADFYSGSTGLINGGNAPDEDYLWARCRLNDSTLYNDENSDIRATIRHEMGHALGLAHSSFKSNIMYKNRDRTTKVVSDNDANGVRYLY
ncbi:matrixin family metalloprotease [Aquibacillus sp. 3ASR75-11]|uniref:Matrixin family metalloprotease n=1 Tax=Terrihalobacillus insolitus TaxID=2950438 RepID=A0A9X3WTZ8_9BACI|nr:matrixin family metalloprotease [Terrihalobacillus insolitus]MDC3414681.1 matrixin family metalloprotease [Terrihalobacillus insolitus]MDC3424206.1 matrixin family metalloprotease [Terrihalobacillus insolitus]